MSIFNEEQIKAMFSREYICHECGHLMEFEDEYLAIFTIPFMKNRSFERSKRSMDEMRIVSKFTRGIISKAIKMVIRKKTGYNIDIQLNEAITTINDGKTHLHLDVDAELDKDELMSILKSIGLN